MDLTESIAPRSDQMNAEDLLTGPRTFTITEVTKGNAEQPFNFHLAEFPRPFRPSKTVRRIIVAAWGKESSTYTGRRLTLFRDPTVKWAGEAIGGIRVSHLSHIDQPLSIALTETRGKRIVHSIQILASDAPAAEPVTETDLRIAELTKEWHTADDSRKAEIQVEVEALREAS